jgi:hypothetical protein
MSWVIPDTGENGKIGSALIRIQSLLKRHGEIPLLRMIVSELSGE